jgi:hypothetical protein
MLVLFCAWVAHGKTKKFNKINNLIILRITPPEAKRAAV